jgi:adenosine deaminase
MLAEAKVQLQTIRLNASYNLIANGTSLNTNAATQNYSFTHTNIQSNQSYELQITQGSSSLKFSVIVNPNATNRFANWFRRRYKLQYRCHKSNFSFRCPGKDFIYKLLKFNNWQPNEP